MKSRLKQDCRVCSARAFTLIEMLVASLLLGMLVTILTMVFNQSSIAWRTGKSSVAQLSNIRYKMARAQYLADNALPRIKDNTHGLVTSAWNTRDGLLKKRAVEKLPSSLPFQTQWSSADYATGNSTPLWTQITGLDNLKFGSPENSFVVGVLSYGPDGIRDTADDISSWPESVE